MHFGVLEGLESFWGMPRRPHVGRPSALQPMLKTSQAKKHSRHQETPRFHRLKNSQDFKKNHREKPRFCGVKSSLVLRQVIISSPPFAGSSAAKAGVLVESKRASRLVYLKNVIGREGEG